MNIKNICLMIAIGALATGCAAPYHHEHDVAKEQGVPDPTFFVRSAGDTSEMDDMPFCANEQKGTSSGMSVSAFMNNREKTGVITSEKNTLARKRVECPGH